MNNFEIFSKLVAISIVGGVAKALFSQPRQGSTSAITNAVVSNLSDSASTAAKRASSR